MFQYDEVTKRSVYRFSLVCGQGLWHFQKKKSAYANGGSNIYWYSPCIQHFFFSILKRFPILHQVKENAWVGRILDRASLLYTFLQCLYFMAQYASYLKTLICQSLSLLLFDVDLKFFVTFWLEPNILNKMRLFQAWGKKKKKKV